MTCRSSEFVTNSRCGRYCTVLYTVLLYKGRGPRNYSSREREFPDPAHTSRTKRTKDVCAHYEAQHKAFDALPQGEQRKLQDPRTELGSHVVRETSDQERRSSQSKCNDERSQCAVSTGVRNRGEVLEEQESERKVDDLEEHGEQQELRDVAVHRVAALAVTGHLAGFALITSLRALISTHRQLAGRGDHLRLDTERLARRRIEEGSMASSDVSYHGILSWWHKPGSLVAARGASSGPL